MSQQPSEEQLVKSGMRVVHAVINRTNLKLLQNILEPVKKQMDAAPPSSDWYQQPGMTKYLISVELDVEQAKALYRLLKTPVEEV